MTQIRLDADYFAYLSAQASETEINDGGSWHMIVGDLREAQKSFCWHLSKLQEHFDSDDVVLYFTSSNNFRKQVDPEYKGHRIKRKPVGYRALIGWCCEEFDCQMVDTLEADDLLGIDCHLCEDDFILVSPDKDLKQISCRQYNLKEECFPTPEEADLFFFTQVLTGDTVDGYKGVPGIGPAKAKALLESSWGKDPWPTILTAYATKGLTEDDALRNARLARILRPGEFDFETNTPILWTPS
jgi:DNA polymerase-1